MTHVISEFHAPVQRAQNVKRADPVNRSIHVLLTNQHTADIQLLVENQLKPACKYTIQDGRRGGVSRVRVSFRVSLL